MDKVEVSLTIVGCKPLIDEAIAASQPLQPLLDFDAVSGVVIAELRRSKGYGINKHGPGPPRERVVNN